MQPTRMYSVRPSWTGRRFKVRAASPFHAMQLVEEMAKANPTPALRPFINYLMTSGQSGSVEARRYHGQDRKSTVDVVVLPDRSAARTD